ncbi:MAG: tRNA uridine-5-carboxymethylaminomethyl(34) synthesis GTPase MnmE, partial [Selenomonadaceae bacterium]|nr:tRNA uridine-5-carboxymethylaminomethyl(34) synthesis GTPase MnmE [Selenomonadaceae bacterium]
MQQSDTISAIATPQGTAGIGIIRISGETAIGTAEKIFFPVCGKKLSDMESHRA